MKNEDEDEGESETTVQLESPIIDGFENNAPVSVFKEQRLVSRKLLCSRAAVSFDGNALDFCRCLDLSSTGMSVNMEKSRNVGEFGIIIFELPFNGEIKFVRTDFCVIQCIFSRGSFRVGIKFCAMNEETINLVSKYLR